MSDLAIVLRSLQTRLFQTLVTAATVAIGVGLLLTLLSMRESGRDVFKRGSGNVDLLVTAEPGALVSVLNGLFYAGAPANPIPWSRFVELRDGYPWQWAIPMQQGDNYRGYPVLATTSDFLTRYEPEPGVPWRMAEGRVFESPFEVVVGAEVARATRLGLGDRLTVTHGSGGSREDHGHSHDEYDYTVVGILEPSGSAHDRALFSDLDSSWVLHAFDRHEREGRHVHVGVDDLEEVDRAITGILLKVPSRGGTSAALPQQFVRLQREGFTVAQPAQEIGRLLAIVGNIDGLLVAMAIAVLLASGVGIMLALYSSMDLRRRQVAILRVLGASAGRVFSIVLTESALIGLGGALLGVGLAAAGSAIVASTLVERLGLVVPWSLDARLALIVVLGTTLLASLAGLLPAMLAYRTHVADHLKPIG
ncbi:MAG: ABC transporter permease [Phycisphaerales bacterium]